MLREEEMEKWKRLQPRLNMKIAGEGALTSPNAKGDHRRLSPFKNVQSSVSKIASVTFLRGDYAP